MAIQLSDIPSAPEGMNLQDPPWQIPDGQCRFLVDALLHKPNNIWRRGPLIPGTTPYVLPTGTLRGIGIVATEDVDENWKVAVLDGDSTHSYLEILGTNYSAVTQVPWATSESVYFDPTKLYRVATGVHPRGGALIGVQRTTSPQGQTSLGHWGGAARDNYSTGKIKGLDQDTLTATMVTGTVDAAMKGMFLYAICDIATGSGKNYIGMVESVDTGANTLTLRDGALFAVTNGATGRDYILRSVRALDRRIAKGTITCTTGSATVDGANTKFKRQGVAATAPNDKWALFRADDMKYVGLVTSVASDTQLTLTAPANINCNKDKFVAINLKGDLTKATTDATDFGWITAAYAGRTWYANRPYSNKAQPKSAARVWFSDILEPEAIDITADGDHIPIPSTKPPLRPVTAMFGLPNALVVFKENEVYTIQGTDESNFSIHRVDVNDGCPSPMTVQPYKDGVVWAGEKGIWFFDGQEAFDITEDRIGDWYERALENGATRTNGAHSFLYKGNYFLYIPKAAPQTGPDRSDNQTNAEEGTPADHIALVVDLERRAFSTLSNFAFIGGVASPNEELLGTIFLTNKCNDSTPFALAGWRLSYARDLFETDGIDTILTELTTRGASTKGPDFYMESKRYDLGEAQLKKRYKQLQMNYRLDTITGDFVTDGHIDPTLTFGNTTPEAFTYTLADNYKFASKFTNAEAFALDTVYARLDGNGGGAGTQTIKACIYADSAGSPGALLATSAEVTIAAGAAAAWKVFAFASPLAVTATDYWIAIHCGPTANVARCAITAVALPAPDNWYYNFDGYSGGPDNPFGTPTSYDVTGSLYASGIGVGGQTDYDTNYLSFATLVGLNELSTTSNGKWNPTRALNSQTPRVWKVGYQNKRIKFNKRSTHLGFKMWQANKTGIKRLRIGAMAIGSKPMRPGRV